ncbi:uncharacterized protein LOC130283171 [Hyla sarda]|uniref:uncharacterized protein LOC130283171 n=1 Tax=Hyla sarda TaxID=327740 RepID=UPI0024C25055|nr:uncharacterized protein LOC130283171 [Hyla sarda]
MASDSHNLFVYTNEDIDKILSGPMGDGEFLSTPSKVDVKRTYEMESRRLISLTLHLSLLGRYYRQKMIPRGLRPHLRPNLFPNNTDFCRRFEGLTNKYAMDIMLLNIEFLQQEIEVSESHLAERENELKSILEPEDLNLYLTKTKGIMDKFKYEQEENKRQKWHRDQDDYKTGHIYNWQCTDLQEKRQRGAKTSQPPRKQRDPRDKVQQRFLGGGQNLTTDGGGEESDGVAGDGLNNKRSTTTRSNRGARTAPKI